MKSQFVFALIVAASSLSISRAAADQGHAKEIANLEDNWIAHIDEKTSAEMVLRDGSLTYIWFEDGGQRKKPIWLGTYTIDPKQWPKHMTWLAKDPNKPNAPKNNAIYRLEGDLLLVIGNNRGERPTKFYSGGIKRKSNTVVFQRKSTLQPVETK